jgi:hypothetical protein
MRRLTTGYLVGLALLAMAGGRDASGKNERSPTPVR